MDPITTISKSQVTLWLTDIRTRIDKLGPEPRVPLKYVRAGYKQGFFHKQKTNNVKRGE